MKIKEDLKEAFDGPNAENKARMGLRYLFVDQGRPANNPYLVMLGFLVLAGIVCIFALPAYIIIEILGFDSGNPLVYLLGTIGFFVGLYIVGIIGYYLYISD